MMAADEKFETTEEELRQLGWLSPEDREIITRGFQYMADTHHEGQHTVMINVGKRTPASCDARSCKYAMALLQWLRPERT